MRVASQAADAGHARTVLYLLVAINVFVGMFNMVPLLPFDGGHVAIATYERIRSRKGKPLPASTWPSCMPITYLVVMLLVFVAVTVALPRHRPAR